MYRLKRD